MLMEYNIRYMQRICRPYNLKPKNAYLYCIFCLYIVYKYIYRVFTPSELQSSFNYAYLRITRIYTAVQKIQKLHRNSKVRLEEFGG